MCSFPRHQRRNAESEVAHGKDGWLAERAEAGAELFGKQVRLFPRGEVPAPVGLVEVDEVWVDLLGPAARRLEEVS